MTTASPLHDFYTNFTAAPPVGMGLGTGYRVMPYTFIDLAGPTITLVPYDPEEERNVDRYHFYPIQIAVYVPYTGDAGRIPAMNTADQYAQTVRDAYKVFDDSTSLAKGLACGSWTADSLSTHLMGVVEDIPSSGGGTVKAVVNIRLHNLHLTGA